MGKIDQGDEKSSPFSYGNNDTDMEWLNILLGALVAVFAGLNIFQLFSFRAYKKKYTSEAEKDEAEAKADKQMALEKRLAAVEQLYEVQGKVVDDLRKEILELKQKKFESDKKMVQLLGENQTLNEKFQSLTKQLEAYKTLVNEK